MRTLTAIALSIALSACSFAVHDRPTKSAPVSVTSCKTRVTPLVDIGMAVALGVTGAFFAVDNARADEDRITGEVGSLNSCEVTMTAAGMSFFAGVLYLASGGTAWRWGSKCRAGEE